jgi:DNA repair protein RAD50
MSFLATTGAKMVSTRSLQLTVKKATRSVKSLEGQLLMIKEGERTSISSRVAELDQLMPQYLGVSKAVLDSVIFCHQDESLWPLSEPSKLKERFDAIFEAMKYTKAIDNIKIMKKKQTEELAKYKIIEQHSKQDKDKGDKAEKRSRELYEEIDALRLKGEDMGNKIAEAKLKYNDAWEKIKFLGGIVGQLSGKRIEQRAKQESVQKLKRNLREMTDSDQDLQLLLEQYQERVQALHDEADEEKHRYQQLARELADNREKLSEKDRQVGQFDSDQKKYERQLHDREQLVKQTARTHNVRGYDLEVDEEKAREFIDRVSRMAKEQNSAFEQARHETQQELQRAQGVLNRINEQKSTLNQKKESAKASHAANRRRIDAFQTDLNHIEVDEGAKTMLESSVEDTESKLRTAKSDYEIKGWDKQVDDTDAALRRLDDQKEKLDSELVQATRQAGDSARLDFLRKEVKDRQRSLDTMTNTHGAKIDSVVGSGWHSTSLDSDFQGALTISNNAVMEAERQRDGQARELEQLEYRFKQTKSDLTARRRELDASQKTIRNVTETDPSEYQKILEETEAERDERKSSSEYAGHLKKYYESAVRAARENKCCLMCRRGYEKDRQGLEKLINFLGMEITKAEAGRAVEELQETEKYLQEVRAISATYDTWTRLKSQDIPNLEQEAERLKTRVLSLTSEVEEGDRVVSERKSARQEVEGLSKTVQNIVKYAQEVSNFEKQIEELASKQKSQGLSRGMETIQDDLKTINEQSRAAKVQLTKIIGERDGARGTINALELELRDVKSKLSTVIYHLKEKASLEKQINELKSQNNEHMESQRACEQELSNLGPEMAQAHSKYDDIARRGAEKDKQLREETAALNDSLNKLQTIEREIGGYIQRDGPAQLAQAKKAIEDTKQEIIRLDDEMKAITKQVKDVEKNLQNVEETKRQIADNQEYRRDLAAVEAIGAEISELETHNAEEEKASHEREGSRWEMARNKLTAEQASIMGQLKSKDDQLQQLLQDWEQDYKDAAYKYKEAHIKVETTKAAVEDLGRYGGALDKAIMRYHALKMEEINRIIEELWKKTYRGTDVDSILIRSDNDNMKGNKSYNYRVVMCKQDAEMDMRGRCSAGQKVLASIIIRLALAECFGVNCGLIALDEPTTNLDRDNIRSLAESLSEIIRIRRQQSNFQLIVITHDEEFLRYMNCADYTDYYYRVSRNEKQKSIIVRQNIADVSFCQRFRDCNHANQPNRSSEIWQPGGCVGSR